MKNIFLIAQALMAIKELVKAFEKYVIIPIKKYLEERKEKSIKDHHDNVVTHIDETIKEIEILSKQENSKENDEEIRKKHRELMRK